MSRKVSSGGFSAIETIIVIVVVVAIGLGGWYVWHRNHQQKKATSTSSSNVAQTGKQSTTQQPADPYTGWKTATSAMTGFTIKYPTTWAYKSIIGKDDAEHITIDSTHMHLTIDSYSGVSDAKCPDCSETLNSSTFTAPNLGAVDLKTITYYLDNGKGNALVLELPDSTYYLPSKAHANVSTTFRGISVLDSEQEYQAEPPSQFTANSDYKTAQQILQSIAY
jgi:Tfp pilus assembly protein PilV